MQCTNKDNPCPLNKEAEPKWPFIGPKYRMVDGRLLYWWAGTGAWGGVPTPPCQWMTCSSPEAVEKRKDYRPWIRVFVPVTPYREVVTRQIIRRESVSAKVVEGSSESGIAMVMSASSRCKLKYGDLFQYRDGKGKWFGGGLIDAVYAGRPGELLLGIR